MRYVLILFACAFVLVFGAVSLVQSYTPASAGIGAADNTADDFDDGFDDCHDDGDDDNEPADEPDDEDLVEDGPHGEEDAADDEDPAFEPDDEVGCVRVEPATPTCPPIAPDGVSNGECCPLGQSLIAGDVFHCVCSDAADGDVGAEGACLCDGTFEPNACLCQEGFTAPNCCAEYGQFCGVVVYSASDADCDGEVTAGDAYQTLAYLSGVEASIGGGCGGGSPGDADCNTKVDAADSLLILSVVAGLEEAPAC